MTEATLNDPDANRDFIAAVRGMLAAGIYLPPSQFETMFVSLAHDESSIERLVEAARRVLADI